MVPRALSTPLSRASDRPSSRARLDHPSQRTRPHPTRLSVDTSSAQPLVATRRSGTAFFTAPNRGLRNVLLVVPLLVLFAPLLLISLRVRELPLHFGARLRVGMRGLLGG